MNNLYLYNNIAFSDLSTIKKVQEKRLRAHFNYCCNNSPYYQKILKKENINLKLENLAQLPFTEKGDIEKYNDDFCAVEQEKIRDIVLSSGTTGKPTKIMYSDYDLRRLAYNEEKSFRSCGITSKDIALLTCTLDRCFVAGLAYFLGMRALGATAIRNGHGTLESHLQVIDRSKPTVIVGVPTFLKKLGLYLRMKKRNSLKTSVSKLICIGEPLRDKELNPLKIKEELEDIWKAKSFSTYASSETVTTFCDCQEQAGGHLHPDLAVTEIIDDQGKVLPVGKVGELVVTPLAVEAMPLIRFKTGDMTFLINDPCKCGRNSLRLGPILGRKKQMMKVKGTTLYPQSIYSVLEEIDVVSDYFITATKDSELSENITVTISLKDAESDLNLIKDTLKARLRVNLSVKIEDEQVIKKYIYRQKYRKPVRFFDKR